MKCQIDNCTAYSTNDSTSCFRHNPDKKQQQLLASTKGGQNRTLQGSWGPKVTLNSAQDIQTFLGDVINGVWTGEVPVPVGTSMGFLAKCWLEAHNAAEIDTRLEALEKRVIQNKL